MGAAVTSDERIHQLEKIRALLNKAESTDFPDAARLLTEKAQDLMTKYALSEYELRMLDDPSVADKVETREVKLFAPHTMAKGYIFDAAAKGNGCKSVFGYSDSTYERVEQDGDYVYRDLTASERYRTVHVTGFSRDIDNAEMLYTSLLLQATKELLQSERPVWENTRTWNKSFYIGYGREIEQRLVLRRRAVAQDTVVTGVNGVEHNLLPVLASRTEQVKTEYEQVWKGRLSSVPIGRVGRSGYLSGHAAGKRADVGDPSVGSRKGLGR